MQPRQPSKAARVGIAAVLLWCTLAAQSFAADAPGGPRYAGRTASEWRALLGAEQRVLRLMAIQALGELREVNVLVDQLDSDDPAVRHWAAFYLRYCGPVSEKALAKLTARLKDEDPIVRTTAAATLVHLGNSKGLTIIIGELNNPQRGAVIWALTELRDLGKKAAAAEAAVRRRTTSNVSYYRRLAQEFLRRLGYQIDLTP